MQKWYFDFTYIISNVSMLCGFILFFIFGGFPIWKWIIFFSFFSLSLAVVIKATYKEAKPVEKESSREISASPYMSNHILEKAELVFQEIIFFQEIRDFHYVNHIRRSETLTEIYG